MADTIQPASGAESGPSRRTKWQPRSPGQGARLPKSSPDAMKPAPGAGCDRLTVRLSGLPPEALGALTASGNRAEYLRAALVWYVSHGQALARIEAVLADLAARLERLEAMLTGGAAPVPASPPPAAKEAEAALVQRQTAALAAWLDDD